VQDSFDFSFERDKLTSMKHEHSSD